VKHIALRGGWVLPVLFLFCASPVAAQSPAQSDPPSRVLLEGEELTYNVRYAFLDLGQIRIKTVATERHPGVTAFKTFAYIDSYKNVPLVDLHAIFESRIDSTVFSRGFTGKVKQDNVWDFARYNFEYDRHRVIMEIGQRDTVVAKRETLVVDGNWQDGLSLFFFARHQLFSGRDLNVPALVKESKVNTWIRFDKRRDEVEIDATDYPVDVVGFEGNAEFVGIFGLTGGFSGWFSNDDARVPILAKMKVLIGSVTIELMSWKRPGWAPPRVKG
jgi:hypothetical protein